MPSSSYPDGANTHLAAGVKSFLLSQDPRPPFVTTGKIRSPRDAEEILQRGEATSSAWPARSSPIPTGRRRSGGTRGRYRPLHLRQRPARTSTRTSGRSAASSGRADSSRPRRASTPSAPLALGKGARRDRGDRAHPPLLEGRRGRRVGLRLRDPPIGGGRRPRPPDHREGLLLQRLRRRGRMPLHVPRPRLRPRGEPERGDRSRGVRSVVP